MNLLCPNCQKMLTVPEQFAGMLMKCPLCEKTFNVPGLPAPAPVAPPPPTPVVPPAPAETYGLQQEAAAPPAPMSPPSSGSAPGLLSELSKAVAEHTPPADTPPAPTSTLHAGYQKMYAICFSPRILQWVAAAAVVLIFFLQFFPWVGVYPGGVALYQQNAWEAAFNGVSSAVYDLDKKLDTFFPKSVKEPGASVLSIFYVLFFIPTLLVTLGCFVLTIVPLKVPTALQSIMPWRWGIAAALNIFVFLFLVLQLLIGFSIESTVKDLAARKVKEMAQDDKNVIQKEKEVFEGLMVGTLHRRTWLELAVFCHLAAILGTFIVFRAGQNPTRPAPRLSLEW